MNNIPTPENLIAKRLESLGDKPTPKNLLKRVGDVVKKDTAIKILGGKNWPKLETYLNVAKKLEMDSAELELSYYWHKMSGDAKESLSKKMVAPTNQKRADSERVLSLLKYHFNEKSTKYERKKGFIEMETNIKDVLPFSLICLFPEEFGNEKELLDFITNQEGSLDYNRIIICLPDDSTDYDLYCKIARNFEGYQLEETISHKIDRIADKRATVWRTGKFIDWFFVKFFFPKEYCYHQSDIHDFKLNHYANLRLKRSGYVTEAIKYLKHWYDNGTNVNVQLVSGSYGLGKSTLLNKFYVDLCKTIYGELDEEAESYLNYQKPIPIWCPVTSWLGIKKSNPLFTRFIQILTENSDFIGTSGFDTRLSQEVFENLSGGSRRFIFIIDSLDEAIRSSQDLERAINSINYFVKLGHKVIVATRPEIFTNSIEIWKYFPDRNTVETELIPISNEEVDRYIEETLEGFPERSELVKTLNKKYPSILKIPFFLSYTCFESVENQQKLDELFSTNEPYLILDFFVEEWFQREKNRPNKRIRNIEKFIEEIAIETSIRSSNEVSDTNMPAVIDSILLELGEVRDIIAGESPILENLRREARICSFMTVSYAGIGERLYSFKLKPFASYFVGSRVKEELISDFTPDTISLGRIKLQYTDIKLIVSAIQAYGIQELAVERLQKYIILTANSHYCRHWKYRYLGGNSLSILLELSGNQLNIDLCGVSICGFKARNGILKGNWNCLDLSESRFENCDYSELVGNDNYAFSSEFFNDNNGKGGFDKGLISFPELNVTRNWDEVDPVDGYVLIPPDADFNFHVTLRKIKVHGFFIKKTTVTNSEFQDFLIENEFWDPKNIIEISSFFQKRFGRFGSTLHYLKGVHHDGPEYPVVNVPKYVMEEYCQFTNSRINSEVEWEYAVTHLGIANLKDEEFDKVKSTTRLEDNCLGVVGLARNVREMCSDCYWPNLGPAFDYVMDNGINPFFRAIELKDNQEGGPVTRQKGVLRGKAFDDRGKFDVKSRIGYILTNYDSNVGFRVVKDIHSVIQSVSSKDIIVKIQNI